MSVKLIKEDKLDDANKFIANVAKYVENAFSDFEGKWEDKPTGDTFKTVYDKKKYVQNLKYRVYVSGLIFTFSIDIFDMMSYKFRYKSGTKRSSGDSIIWSVSGSYNTVKVGFTIQDANSIVNATKTANKLKSNLDKIFNDYLNK